MTTESLDKLQETTSTLGQSSPVQQPTTHMPTESLNKIQQNTYTFSSPVEPSTANMPTESLDKIQETTSTLNHKAPPAQPPTSKDVNQVWYSVGILVVVIHVVALLSLRYYTPKTETLWLTYVCWQLATLGITAGYHRLWSHKAYKANLPFRYILAFMGAMGFQGSIKWWVLRHRLHHRYTDTEHDPYNAKKGFWYSHMGWMFEKPHYPRLKLIDKSDLDSDPVVVFQHKYFKEISYFAGFILPTIIGAFWGDSFGAFLYGGFVARVFIWHVTWFINSLAHYIGDQIYSTELTARGNLFLAVLTNGEGYHNYHHEFPQDYRNGIHSFDWDPTKWIIYGLSAFGVTFDLKQYSDIEILKAMLSTAEEKIQNYKTQLSHSSSSNKNQELPKYTLQEFHEAVSGGVKKWFLINGKIINVERFIHQHPGGQKLIFNYIGKDATRGFYGNLNNHTKSARAMLDELTVGVISN